MNNEFTVWSRSYSARYNAAKEYRVRCPLKNFNKLNICNGILISNDQLQLSAVEVASLMYSDILLQHNPVMEQDIHMNRSISAKSAAKNGNGDVVVPPAIIYDVDDNLDFVHPFNASGFVSLGVRSYPDGALLSPGDTIMYEDHTKKIAPLWEDQVTVCEGQVFNIQHNLQRMATRHKLLKGAHGATCPSGSLANYWRDVIGQKNVYVFPNTVDFSIYEFYDVVRRDDKIRILWQGGDSHYADWWPLRSALKTISEKYRDKITFVFYGQAYPWVYDVIPRDMIEEHGWSNYHKYQVKRGLLNIDINLCPLIDDVFNRCKSAIKWYEGSIWNKPEATLAQKTGPYNEIAHNETGLLFSSSQEFVEMLSGLIENEALRNKLANNAKQWVIKNRTPEVTLPGLFDFYLDTRNRQKRDLGLSPIKLISTA